MKKKYVAPRLILIGDMTNNTLGASGPDADAAGQSLDDGNPWNNNTNNTRSSNPGFNDSWTGN